MTPEIYAGLRDLPRARFLDNRIDLRDLRKQEIERLKKAAEETMGVENCFRRFRKREVVWAKKLFIYEVLRRGLVPSKLSLSKMVGTNHATIIHHQRTTKDLIEYDQEFKQIYKRFRRIT